jgi:hypothetical protein
VIRFTIPDGVAGCFIPVVVQIGGFVSNLATIAIDPNGAPCTPAVNTLPQALLDQLAGKKGVSLGGVNLGRSTGMALRANGTIATTKEDTGSAAFVRYDNVPASMFAADYKYSENVCQINGYPGPNGGVVVNGTEAPIVPLKAIALDAGPSFTVKGPSGTRTITKRTAGMVFDYPGTNFGDTSPGNYFDPGHYTVTGTGGKDVGAFTASTDVPAAPFMWTNIPSLTTPIDRSKDLTITWTGGVPNTQVTVVSGSLQNGVTAAFLCAAPVSAGQMTIPAYVLLNLAASGPPLNSGQMTVGNRAVSTITIPGLDIASIAYSSAFTVNPTFQ